MLEFFKNVFRQIVKEVSEADHRLNQLFPDNTPLFLKLLSKFAQDNNFHTILENG